MKRGMGNRRQSTIWIIVLLALVLALFVFQTSPHTQTVTGKASLTSTWAGFTDNSTALKTSRYSFRADNVPSSAGTSNPNYYDGAMGDFDGDGQIDRALNSRYGLLWNYGGGFMIPARDLFDFRVGVELDGELWIDVDNDGDLDNIVGGNAEGVWVQYNHRSRFGAPTQIGATGWHIIRTDVNKDGYADILTTGVGAPGEEPQIRLYINDGTGKFTEQAVARGLAAMRNTDMVAGDVDGDGDFDLILSTSSDTVVLARNNGQGFFTETTIATGVTAAHWSFSQPSALGDIDDDGDLDLIFSANAQGITKPKIFINDGSGNFVDATLSRVTGDASNSVGDELKLMDVDYDGDLDIISFAKGWNGPQAFHIFINDGTGHFIYDTTHSVQFPDVSAAVGNDLDVADLNGDGTYDIWVGRSSEDVKIMLNTYKDPSGLPADLPRNLKVISATSAGATLSWQAPPFADTARRYKVYRSTAPNMDWHDKKLIKNVAMSPHTDEAFSAPITRHTTTAYLNDSGVVLIGSNNEIQFTDKTALHGVTYYYAVSHVGVGNAESKQTSEVSATVPSVGGTDTTAPSLNILTPVTDEWSQFPRILLHYADGGSGIDTSSLKVSFDKSLGSGNPADGGRAAGADISDLFIRKDAGTYIFALQPQHRLPLGPVTLTATIKDKAGNSITRTVSFVVSVASASLPVAKMIASPTSGNAPLTVSFNASGSTDDVQTVWWDWFFGDGSTGIGQTSSYPSSSYTQSHTYTVPGTYQAQLLVRDNDGGIGVTSTPITVGSGTGLSTVTVTATDATASEPGTDTGTFTINRVGDTNVPLTVNYVIGGTATAGSDYTALSGSATIPAGWAFITIPLIPIDDAAVEGSETVTLTLSNNASYLIGSPNSALITLVDNDVSVNKPPIVDAGSDQIIILPATATLTGTATDDGLPFGALSVSWTKVSGPGTVTFSSQNIATFSAQGTYVLRLTASDGQFSSSDDVIIIVNSAATSCLREDINLNGQVDIFDLVAVASRFDVEQNQPNYLLAADINKDGIINIFDLVSVATHFGSVCT